MKRKANPKVIAFSLVALLCLYLSYAVSWWFIVIVAAMIWLNQREILGGK